MSLRIQAEQDLSFILEDDQNGFGWRINLTNPEGKTINLIGYSDDIAQSIDPDTGMIVSGRVASIALRISTLALSGFDIPRGISDIALKPWLVEFEDINGNPYTFKIMQSNPDRMLGIVTCLLESYL